MVRDIGEGTVVGSWKGRRSGRQGWPGQLASPAIVKKEKKEKVKSKIK
jgi:hypothetical protein